MSNTFSFNEVDDLVVNGEVYKFLQLQKAPLVLNKVKNEFEAIFINDRSEIEDVSFSKYAPDNIEIKKTKNFGPVYDNDSKQKATEYLNEQYSDYKIKPSVKLGKNYTLCKMARHDLAGYDVAGHKLAGFDASVSDYINQIENKGKYLQFDRDNGTILSTNGQYNRIDYLKYPSAPNYHYISMYCTTPQDTYALRYNSKDKYFEGVKINNKDLSVAYIQPADAFNKIQNATDMDITNDLYSKLIGNDSDNINKKLYKINGVKDIMSNITDDNPIAKSNNIDKTIKEIESDIGNMIVKIKGSDIGKKASKDNTLDALVYNSVKNCTCQIIMMECSRVNNVHTLSNYCKAAKEFAGITSSYMMPGDSPSADYVARPEFADLPGNEFDKCQIVAKEIYNKYCDILDDRRDRPNQFLFEGKINELEADEKEHPYADEKATKKVIERSTAMVNEQNLKEHTDKQRDTGFDR